VTEKATRAPRITADMQREIVSLDIRGRSEVDIAQRLKISRGTVRRALVRGRPLIALTEDLRVERGRALAVLLEVQTAAWHKPTSTGC
jgi:transposase